MIPTEIIKLIRKEVYKHRSYHYDGDLSYSHTYGYIGKDDIIFGNDSLLIPLIREWDKEHTLKECHRLATLHLRDTAIMVKPQSEAGYMDKLSYMAKSAIRGYVGERCVELLLISLFGSNNVIKADAELEHKGIDYVVRADNEEWVLIQVKSTRTLDRGSFTKLDYSNLIYIGYTIDQHSKCCRVDSVL